MIGITRSSTNCRMLSRTARSSSDKSESILKKSSMEAGWDGLNLSFLSGDREAKRWNGGTVERWNASALWRGVFGRVRTRSEEQTSELQSHHDLVCRLLLEKKKKKK